MRKYKGGAYGFSLSLSLVFSHLPPTARPAALLLPGFMMTLATFLLVTTILSTSPLGINVFLNSDQLISRPPAASLGPKR